MRQSAHIAGAVEYLDLINGDEEVTKVLSYDGSLAELLVSNYI